MKATFLSMVFLIKGCQIFDVDCKLDAQIAFQGKKRQI